MSLPSRTFEEYFDEYWPLLNEIAKQKCRSMPGIAGPSTLVQEISLRICKGDLSNPLFRNRGYLLGVAHKTLIDLLRKKMRSPPPESGPIKLDDLPTDIPEEGGIEGREICDKALAALADDAQRRIAFLHHVNGLTLAEIASLQTLSVDQVRYQLSKIERIWELFAKRHE